MRKAWPWILTGIAFLWCIVIWQFSLHDATDSAATSSAVLEQVNSLLSKWGIENLFTTTTIRKTAHFCEFFLLGVLAASALLLHGFRHFVPIAAAATFAVAGIDELLQLFSPGRGPSFADVMLDTAGGVCGIVLFCLVMLAAYHIKEQIAKKREKFSK